MRPMERTLSLGAELLLVGIDPNRGGLLPRRKRRFRKGLAAGEGLSTRLPLSGWRARRRAYAELERGGVLAPDSTPRRPRLGDRDARTAVLRRVRRCVQDKAADEPRDRELLLLMAWTGLLSDWLSRDERRLALRRLQDSPARATQGIGAFGLVGGVATADLFGEAGFGDFGGGEAGGLEPGAASDGGGGGQ
jgi:hypothetical protein